MQQPSKNHQKLSFLSQTFGSCYETGLLQTSCTGQGDLQSTEIPKFQPQIQADCTNSQISISTQQKLNLKSSVDTKQSQVCWTFTVKQE